MLFELRSSNTEGSQKVNPVAFSILPRGFQFIIYVWGLSTPRVFRQLRILLDYGGVGRLCLSWFAITQPLLIPVSTLFLGLILCGLVFPIICTLGKLEHSLIWPSHPYNQLLMPC